MLLLTLNPFTPKSDQVQISPVASPVILYHTVWRTWLFIAYSDWKMILVPCLTTSLIHFSWKGWENVLFELGSERVNYLTVVSLYGGIASLNKHGHISHRSVSNAVYWCTHCIYFNRYSEYINTASDTHLKKCVQLHIQVDHNRILSVVMWQTYKVTATTWNFFQVNHWCYDVQAHTTGYTESDTICFYLSNLFQGWHFPFGL